MKEFKIYQDLDGCLVDFEGGYHKYTGIPCKGTLGADGNWVNGPDFWSLIDYTDFWANLEWMPDGKDLWSYVRKYPIEILSAPSKSQTSKDGKKQWIDKHIPGVEFNLVPRWEKMKYADPNHILIDDMESTIKEWKNEGGVGVLHTSTKDTIKQLKALGL